MANGSTRYRRGSILGALVLITLGGMFLYANINPDFPVWRLIATYWPVLIIFWGISKLVDYLLLRGTPEGAYAARLRGGEIFGLIMLVLLGSMISLIHKPECEEGDEECRIIFRLFQNRYEFPAELSEEIELPATLWIGGRGDVSVSPSEDNRIRIVGQKTVYADSRSEAEAIAERFMPSLEKVEGGYELRWRQEGVTETTPEFDLDLFVPASVKLLIKVRKGDITTTRIDGDLQVDLSDGELRADQAGGNVTARLRDASVSVEDVRGNVSIHGNGEDIRIRSVAGETTVEGEYVGQVRFSEIKGPARFRSRRTDVRAPAVPGEIILDGRELIARNIPGELTVETSSKEIDVDDVFGPLRIENRNGPVVVRYRRPPTTPIEITNRRGRIELLMPANSGFEIEARNEKGGIESEFTGPGLTLDEEGRRTTTLVGRVGRRGTTIQLQTTIGDIELRRVD